MYETKLDTRIVELSTIIKALKFAVKVLKEQSRETGK